MELSNITTYSEYSTLVKRFASSAVRFITHIGLYQLISRRKNNYLKMNYILIVLIT